MYEEIIGFATATNVIIIRNTKLGAKLFRCVAVGLALKL